MDFVRGASCLPTDSLDSSHEPHLRFQVQGHILIVDGDAHTIKRLVTCGYCNTLAASTPIKLFMKALEFLKHIFYKEQIFEKENREYVKVFSFLTWNLQISIIIQ